MGLLLMRCLAWSLLVIGVLLAVPCDMRADVTDIFVDSSSSATQRGNNTMTWSHTVGTGVDRYLLVGVSINNKRFVTSATYGGVPLSLVGARYTAGNADRVEMWELIAPASGTANITITFSGDCKSVGGAISFTNVHQTTPRTATVTANSTGLPGDKGTNPTVTVPTASREVVVDTMVTAHGDNTAAVGANQYEYWNINTSVGDGGGEALGAGSIQPGALGGTMSWTTTRAEKWAIIAVSIQAPVAPSFAVMREAAAEQDNRGHVVIRWSTSFESDNLGFNVYRQGRDGVRAKINKHLVAGSALFTGRDLSSGRGYRWKDKVRDGEFVQYWIEDVDLDGTRTLHGPVTPVITSQVAGSGETDTIADLGSNGGILVSPRGVGAPAYPAGSPSKQQLAQQWDLASQPAVKFLVTEEGWYRVRKSEIVAAGFEPGTSSRSLALFMNGVEQPIVVNDGGDGTFDSNDTIEFYGIGLDSLGSGARAYWLVTGKGTGQRARTEENKARNAAATQTTFSYERIERTVFFTALVNNGEGGNFFGAIVGSWGVTQELVAENVVRTKGGAAQLEVVIQGATNGGNEIQLRMNGRELGEVRLADQQRLATRIAVPLEALVDGTNVLELKAASDEDISVVESLRLTYPHRLVADGDALKVRAGSATPVAIDGFTSNSVRAIDITDPAQPIDLAVQVSSAGGAHRASFVTPDDGPRTVLVAGASRIRAPAQLVPSRASGWNDRNNEADLVIVAARALAPEAEPLAARRNSEGIATRIVDVQDLYDEFGFGVRGAEAIREFLQRTREWKKAPRYVLLLGDASFDPRNYLGMGTYDLVPARLVPGGFLKTSSDDWFADWSGTGIPQLAVGRLPARTPEEARTMIAAIVERGRGAEASGAWSNDALFIADSANDYPFEAMTESLRTELPAGLEPVMLDAGAVPDQRAAILGALGSGQLLAMFAGHGSVDRWVYSGVTGADVARLTNGRRRPIVVGLTCLNGYFHDLYQQSMAEAFLTNPNGGAVAVWTSSALTGPEGQTQMARELLRNLFEGTLGDAIQRAKRATSDPDVRRSWILFGDPSMRVR